MTNHIATWGEIQKTAWEIFKTTTKKKWADCSKAEKILYNHCVKTGGMESRIAYLSGKEKIRQDFLCFKKEEMKVYENAIL